MFSLLILLKVHFSPHLMWCMLVLLVKRGRRGAKLCRGRRALYLFPQLRVRSEEWTFQPNVYHDDTIKSTGMSLYIFPQLSEEPPCALSNKITPYLCRQKQRWHSTSSHSWEAEWELWEVMSEFSNPMCDVSIKSKESTLPHPEEWGTVQLCEALDLYHQATWTQLK